MTCTVAVHIADRMPCDFVGSARVQKQVETYTGLAIGSLVRLRSSFSIAGNDDGHSASLMADFYCSVTGTMQKYDSLLLQEAQSKHNIVTDQVVGTNIRQASMTS